MEFSERTCVITGAGSGIGRGLVTEALTRGMRVVAADVDAPSLASLEESCQATDRLITRPVDVAVYESMDNLARFVFDELGGVDLFFNHAGVISTGYLWEESVTTIDWHLAVNLRGIAYGIRAFVPRMIAAGRPSVIVNTGSLASFAAARGLGLYSAAKHGVLGITEALAHDLSHANAPVEAKFLAPGGVSSAIAQVHRAPAGIVTHHDDELRKFLSDVDGWMPPAEAASVIFDELGADKFWLFTHPDRKGGTGPRHEAMLAEEPPPYREVMG